MPPRPLHPPARLATLVAFAILSACALAQSASPGDTLEATTSPVTTAFHDGSVTLDFGELRRDSIPKLIRGTAIYTFPSGPKGTQVRIPLPAGGSLTMDQHGSRPGLILMVSAAPVPGVTFAISSSSALLTWNGFTRNVSADTTIILIPGQPPRLESDPRNHNLFYPPLPDFYVTPPILFGWLIPARCPEPSDCILLISASGVLRITNPAAVRSEVGKQISAQGWPHVDQVKLGVVGLIRLPAPNAHR